MTILDEAATLTVQQGLSTTHSATAFAHVRQDARRRAYVTVMDALASVSVATITAFALESLPLRTALALPVIWLLCSWLAGSYLYRTLRSGLLDARRLAAITLALWAAAGLLAQLYDLPGLRAVVLVVVPVTAPAVLAGRIALLPFSRGWRRSAGAPVVVVGSAHSVQQFVASHGTMPRVAAMCLTDEGVTTEPADTRTYSVENLTHAVSATGADTVLVLDELPVEQIRKFYWELEPLGVGVAVQPMTDVAPHRTNVLALGNTTLIKVT